MPPTNETETQSTDPEKMPESAADLPVLPGFDIVRELGRGGMGVVYLARRQNSNHPVAVKVIRKDRLFSPQAVRRFRREVQAASLLCDPHIIPVLESEQAGDVLFMVMEYVEGVTLHKMVEERGPLPVHQACDFIRQTALGLQHALEKGLVHRDIKPTNLMIAGAGAVGGGSLDGSLVKILDMGLARLEESGEEEADSTLTKDGILIGTLDYMSPEQAKDPHSADIRSDLYSLGCTFYYVLTGKAPFPGGTALEKMDKHRWSTPRLVSRTRKDVPLAVAAVVGRLLAKKPEDRFQTPAELAATLEPYCVPILFGPAPEDPQHAPDGPVTPVYEPTTETHVADTPIRDTEFNRLKLLLADYLEHSSFREARNLTENMLSLRPADEETLAARAMIEEHFAPAEPLGECRQFRGHTDWVWCVALSPDGRLALSGGKDRSVRIWDVGSGAELKRFDGHRDAVRSVAFSPNGRRVLSAGADRSMQLWDVEAGREIRRYKGHRDVVRCAVFSPDGRRILSCGGDRSVMLWNVDGERPLRTFKGHTGDINCLVFAADGRRAYSAGWDKTVRLWDLEASQEVHRQGGWHSEFQWSVTHCLAYSPLASRLLIGGSDNALRMWDENAQKEVFRLEGHQNCVTSAAFSPDGRVALSGSWDNTLRLWDLESGKELACFDGHSDKIHSVVFAADGVHALTGASDNTVRYWRVRDR